MQRYLVHTKTPLMNNYLSFIHNIFLIYVKRINGTFILRQRE